MTSHAHFTFLDVMRQKQIVGTSAHPHTNTHAQTHCRPITSLHITAYDGTYSNCVYEFEFDNEGCIGRWSFIVEGIGPYRVVLCMAR